MDSFLLTNNQSQKIMRHIKSILTFVLTVAAISACRDNSLSPVPFDTVVNSNGGYIITVATPSPNYDVTNLANAVYSVSIQVYDSRKGEAFQSVDIMASYKDNTPGNGTWNPAEVKVASIPAASFTVDDKSGNPATTISIKAEDAIAALGGTDANVSGSDAFIYRQVLVMKDGATYSVANTDINILAGAYYQAPFTGTCPLVCPSTLEGTYTTTVSGTDQLYGDYAWVFNTGDPVGNMATYPGHTLSLNAHPGTVGTITITHTAAGSVSYNVSDVSSGVFNGIYYQHAAYGAPQFVPYVISDACGSIDIPAGDDGWGDTLSGSATVVQGTNGGIVYGGTPGKIVIKGKWVTNSGDSWNFTWTQQ